MTLREPTSRWPLATIFAGDGSFEFACTNSRLEEMQSADYLAEGRGAT